MNNIKWLGALRIYALLLVLIYHFFRSILPGGFIGVDIFFTLSGYLTTASIVLEFSGNGIFNPLAFFKRRFFRIFPPLLLCILFSLPFTLMLSPDFTVNIGRQLASALGFVTNYFEIINGGSYEAQMLPHLFLHTWFLSVEVQLYIIWAILCSLITLALALPYRSNPQKSTAVLKAMLFVFSAAAAVFSYLRMQALFAGTADPSAAYFDTGARAFSFLLGAAAGSIFPGAISKSITESSMLAKIIAALMVLITALAAAALALMARNLEFTGESAYRYGFALASLLTVILIQSVRILDALTPGIQEPLAITVPAKLSYNIYLFHWPLFNVFFFAGWARNVAFWNSGFAAIAALALSAAFSALVFYGIEPLFRLRLPFTNLDSLFLRRFGYAVIILFVIAALPLNGVVFAHAPEISSLEEELNTGYLYQDTDEIEQLQHLTGAINGSPLILSGTPGALQNNTSAGNTADMGRFELSALTISFNEEGILAGVTIIGDSVTLGARRYLAQTIPDCHVDAEGSRQFAQGYDLINALQNNDSLREYVVVALGTNANENSFSYIDRIAGDLPDGHRLIFVTPFNASMNETWITYKILQYLRKTPDRFPYVTVADWAEAIGKQPRLLGSDKVHIGGNPTAISLYTNCIIDALNIAGAKPAK